MPSMKRILLIFIYLLTIYSAKAQKTDAHDHHEHQRHEVSVGAFPVFFLNESETAYGMHFHYVYNIPATRAGIGLGFEKIFDEHQHNTLGINLSYRPFEKLNIGLTPGFTFEGSEINSGVPSLHLETAWEFAIGALHLGPVVGFGVDKNEMHMGVGIHFGMGF